LHYTAGPKVWGMHIFNMTVLFDLSHTTIVTHVSLRMLRNVTFAECCGASISNRGHFP